MKKFDEKFEMKQMVEAVHSEFLDEIQKIVH